MKKTLIALLALALGAFAGYISVSIVSFFYAGLVFGVFASLIVAIIVGMGERGKANPWRYIVFIVGSGVACFAAEFASIELARIDSFGVVALIVAGLIGGLLTMASFAVFRFGFSSAKNIGLSLLSAAIAPMYLLGGVRLFVVWQAIMLFAIAIVAMRGNRGFKNIIGDGKLAPSEAMPIAESLSSQLFPERTHQNPPQQG